MFSIVSTPSNIHLFGVIHLLVLVTGLVTAYLIIRRNKTSKIFEILPTIIMLIAYICLYTWYYFSPESFLLKGLPLYTCRIAVYILAIGIFFNKKQCLKLGVYWGLFGGFFGLLLPTIFDYSFPHILQISTFYLHIYLFTTAVYYLFVKKIGMNKEDLRMCCKSTIIFLSLAHIVNIILNTNYVATFKMPGVLLKFGINFPSSLCFLIVVTGYLIAIVTQFYILKKIFKEVGQDVSD